MNTIRLSATVLLSCFGALPAQTHKNGPHPKAPAAVPAGQSADRALNETFAKLAITAMGLLPNGDSGSVALAEANAEAKTKDELAAVESIHQMRLWEASVRPQERRLTEAKVKLALLQGVGGKHTPEESAAEVKDLDAKQEARDSLYRACYRDFTLMLRSRVYVEVPSCGDAVLFDEPPKTK